uniref:Uncharacterized protein AlNc14C505G11968 n=1 Tax=Albugo laibachii Nc14 TaxID=890382 RepID=F0X0M3_9STRA|nr:conserved hypothetical protein [Albugo laibachii Nc14]|eukprot:CCA27315.1 conserved hypothetical protein [Albugo laibachii Nc14]
MTRHQGRTSIKGIRTHAKKYLRTQYNIDYKHAVVEHYRAFGIDNTITRFFASEQRDAARKRISKWNKNAYLISALASNPRTANHDRMRSPGIGTVLSPAAEEEIVGWINELCRDGVPVSATVLQLKAREVAQALGIEPGLFVASNPWKASFLRRYRLVFRIKNRAGQTSLDDDNELSCAFAAEVREWMQKFGVTKVYNADQTFVFCEMLPKKTINARGEQTVWVKYGRREKQRATAMRLADSDGNKFRPFIVFKAKSSRNAETQALNVSNRHGFGRVLWREIKELQDENEVQIYGNSTAWWNSSMTSEWTRYNFGDRTTPSEPILLLFDSFSGHWTDKIQAYDAMCNVHLKAVPPKITWRCQPDDVAWMKPLKDKLRTKWVENLRDQLARHNRGSGAFLMSPPDPGVIAHWISQSWLAFSTPTIISGFARCGFVHLHSVLEEEPDLDDTTDLVPQQQACGLLDAQVGDMSVLADLVDSAISINQ